MKTVIKITIEEGVIKRNIEIDNSSLSKKEQFDIVLKLVKEKL